MQNHRGKIFFFSFFLISVSLLIFLNIIIGPLIISFAIAYFLNPLFNFLEQKGMSRPFLSLITVFILLIFSILCFWFFFPVFFQQVQSLIKLLPSFKIYLENHFLPKIQDIFVNICGYQSQSLKIHHLSDIIPFNMERLSDAFLSKIAQSTRLVGSFFITIFLTPFFCYFLMRDFNKIHQKIISFIPIDVIPRFVDFFGEVDKKLRSVLCGQSLVILSLCCLYPFAFLIAGLPAAIAVGVLTGLARFIPYMDIVVGSFLCFFVLATNSVSQSLVLYVSLSFLIVQLLDGLFITPKIMGKFSGLHPSLVILSVLCFGDWFGFYGVLLAVPIAAVGKVSFDKVLKTYKESVFFKYGNN